MMTCAVALVGVLLAAEHGRVGHPSAILPPPSHPLAHHRPAALPAARHAAQHSSAASRTGGGVGPAPGPPPTSIGGAPATTPALVTSQEGSTSAAPSAPVTTSLPLRVSPASATPTPSLVRTGWLEGPMSISATYPLASDEGRSITATWTGTATLDLGVSCDGGASSARGSSGLHLVAAAGSCVISLSGPADVATTSFHIVVTP